VLDRSRPTKISQVVLTARVPISGPVFHRRARLQLSRQHAHDGVPRCSADHHALRSFATTTVIESCCLTAADIDGLIARAGRVSGAASTSSGGVGRTGPEATVSIHRANGSWRIHDRMDQLDDATHVPRMQLLAKNMPNPDRWGGGGWPARRRTGCAAAMSGALYLSDRNWAAAGGDERCETSSGASSLIHRLLSLASILSTRQHWEKPVSSRRYA